MTRELDDAILHLRSNEPDLGCWLIQTQGDCTSIMQVDETLAAHKDHWFVNEVIGLYRRTLSRLDVSSRSLIGLIDEGSCFFGSLFELALACDRTYHLALPETPDQEPTIQLGTANFGTFPMITDQYRLERRFYADQNILDDLRAWIGVPLDAQQAVKLGLVTADLDDLDWEDEIRLVLEERSAMSPDALTGLEANLRFNGVETMETRIFGRLSSWQNWIFQRPNAVGEEGALKRYGSGERINFDRGRV
jgi:benzoyl-CoA-dihydrodiol lyase